MTAPAETPTSMAYIASLPGCGCIVAATVDGEHRADMIRDIEDWLSEGLDINRRPVEDVRADPAFLRDCGGEGHRS